MTRIMVVVANSSKAQIFNTKTLRGPLTLGDTLSHPQSRLKEQDLVSDTHGRAFDSGGHGRHAMEDKTTAKKYELLQFAREISHRIESDRTRNRFDELVIVAAPEFLGELRHTMTHPSKECVVKAVSKNLVGHDPSEIVRHLFE